MKLPRKLLATALVLLPAACDVESDELQASDELQDEAIGAAAEADELVASPDAVGAAADCCATGAAASCGDLAVQSCVCAADSYCCNNAWDSICVGEVESLGCGSCETTVPCCETGAAGCALPAVESCVCAADSYCCNVAWDSICVGEVESLGCGTCGAVDVAITDLSLPTVACPGENIGPSSSLELTNVGAAGVTSLFHVGWYLSSDATLGGDRLLLGGRDQVASLAAGASTSVSINANVIPGDATPGPQYIIVSADEFNGVSETDELNNILATPITIEPECVAEGEWARSIGGSGSESLETGGAVATDTDGNVYVVGHTSGTSVDLGDGPVATIGAGDAYLVSYDADGAFRWSQMLASNDWDYASGVGVDAAGNVYVTGESEGSMNLGGGLLTHSGDSRDVFVASYTQAGAHRWSQMHGSFGSTAMASDLAVDAAGNVVVVGQLDGAMDMGGGVLTAAGSTDMFVLALNSTGSHRWSRALGGTGWDVGAGVAVDASGGAVVVGSFSGTVDVGTGPVVSAGAADGLTVRLNASGVTQWASRYGGTSSDLVQGVVIDAAGNSTILGGFGGTINLGDGPRVAVGTLDVLIASYDAAGALRWSRRGGGSSLDYGRGIALDAAGHPVATGGFFGATADYGGTPLTNAGNYDTWVASYASADGSPRWAMSLGSTAREDGYDVAVSTSGTVVVVGTFASTLSVVGTNLVSLGSTDVFVASVLP